MYGIRTKAFATPSEVSVGTSATVILTLTPAGLFSAMVVEIASAAGSAASLNSFSVQRKDHAGGEWYDYLTTWASPYPLGLSYVSATPATLAADATVHLHIDIGSAYGIRLRATVAADTADITAVGLLGDATLPGALAEVNISGFATETSLAAAAADLNELTAAPIEKQPTGLAAVAITNPGTPLVLAANGTWATELTVQAGRATTVNTALVSVCSRIGGSFVSYATQRQIELAPGESKTYRARDGKKFDLNDFAVDGVTVGDSLRIEYTPA